jgi:hypothetical protein
MFRTVPLSIIRSLFTVHSEMVYVIQVCREQDQDGTAVPSWSCSKAVCKPVWHIPLPSVQWINSWWLKEELSETCRVACQNKCEISASSWFYYKAISYDAARSHENKKHICLKRFKILQPPVQSVPGASSLGIKGQRHEAKHSPPSSRG